MTNPFSTMSQTNKIIVGAVLAALVIFGGFATYFLVNQNQELRQQARVDGGTGGVVGVDDEKPCGSFSHGYQACNPAGGARSYKLCDNGTMRTFSCGEGQKCEGGRCQTAQGTTETTGSGADGTSSGGTGGGDISNDDDQDWSAAAPCDSQDFKNITGTTLPPGGKTCSRDLKRAVTCNTHGTFTAISCTWGCGNGTCLPEKPADCMVAGVKVLDHNQMNCSTDKKKIQKCINGVITTSTTCTGVNTCGTLPNDTTLRCIGVLTCTAGSAEITTEGATKGKCLCSENGAVVEKGASCNTTGAKAANGLCNANQANPILGCVSNSAYKDPTCTLTGWRCGPKPATVTGNVSTLSSTRTTTSGTACATGTCTSSGTQCVAIHRCDALDENNHCTIGAPEVRRGTQSLNAQQIANESCKCVQLDVLSGANGTCDDGHIKNADYSTLLGAVQVCPNAQANCGGTGGAVASPTTETTTTTTTTTTCGQSCNSTTLCPSNHSCSSGVCKLNACLVAGANCNANQCAVLTASPTPSPTLVCNSACTATSQCPQDHTCATNGKCQLTECVNGQACAADLCRLNRCGESCTANSDCPNNHQCSNNKCILNACATNPTLCSTDKCRVTQCGETCSTNADCPNDHTCNSGTCKLNACLVPGASCNANKCAVTTTVAVLGCNQPCSSNPDCQAIDHICVDTADGKRCRLETNIASETCGGAVVAGPPTSLPVAGSADLLKAIGVGAFALVVGALGFFLL